MNNSNKNEKEKQENKCPKCNSNEITPIVYGYPGNELWEKYERGEVILGGCCLDPDAKNNVCKKCKHRW